MGTFPSGAGYHAGNGASSTSGVLAGEPSGLVLLAEDPGAENAQFVTEQHRHGHQRQVERIAGGRDDGGDDHVQDDGVAAVLGEELVVDDADHGEEGQHKRQLENDPESQDERHDQAELLIHHQHRLDVRAGAVDEELERGRQDDEVAERRPSEEEERGGEHEGKDGATLAPIESRSDERPDLPEDGGQCHEQPRVKPHLQVDEERLDAAGEVERLLSLGQRLENRHHEEMKDRDRPVVRGDEAEAEKEHRPLEPLAQFEQVLAQREMDVVLGPFAGRDRLRQRGGTHFASFTASAGAEVSGVDSVGAGGSRVVVASSLAASRATTPSGGTSRSDGEPSAEAESGDSPDGTPAAARRAAARADAGSAGATAAERASARAAAGSLETGCSMRCGSVSSRRTIS